jgi:hypothetical protein
LVMRRRVVSKRVLVSSFFNLSALWVGASGQAIFSLPLQHCHSPDMPYATHHGFNN